MATKRVNELTSVGNIADGDVLVGERVSGTTVSITFNGVLYDADFASDGMMARTASGVYANRTLTGTADMVDISNGDGIAGNPTFTIASTYAGGTSITSVGTVTVGTWSANAIALNKITALTVSRAVVSDGSGFLTVATTTAAELEYVNGVTSAIQTQLNTKITATSADVLTNKSIDADTNTITNIENADIKAAAAIAVNKLAAVTVSRALVSDGSGFVSAATTTATEIGYVNGVTSAIQTQMNLKAPLISPSFTTPALGTPSSGVLTSCTGLPIAGIANGTDGELITWDASGVAAAVAVGTSGHVLTSNGAGAAPTFQATGGVVDGDKGDITTSAGGTVYTIDNTVVTYAKIQNITATDKILGRSTAGAGVTEEIACTSFGRDLLDDASVSAQRITLGLDEGTWTPTVTFVTPGNVSVSYSTQVGQYRRWGAGVECQFALVFTLTHTTASGSINIGGLPFTASSFNTNTSMLYTSNVVIPASRTWVTLAVTSAAAIATVIACGTATTASTMDIAALPTGATTYTLRGWFGYGL